MRLISWTLRSGSEHDVPLWVTHSGVEGFWLESCEGRILCKRGEGAGLNLVKRGSVSHNLACGGFWLESAGWEGSGS